MKQIFLIVAGFIFATVIFTYPAIFHLSDKIIGDGGDNYQFLAFQYLANQEFISGKFPFGWTNYWRYPVGFDFSTSYDSTLLMTVGIVLYQFTSDPVVVYNISVLLFLFLGALLSFLFFEKVTGDKLLGVIGGLIYGFSFYNIARMGGHPNLIPTGCFPLFLYALLTFIQRKGDKYSFVLLTLSTIFIFLVSLQYLLIFTAGLIFFIPLTYLFYKEELQKFFNILLVKRSDTILSLFAILSVFLFFNSTKLISYVNHTLILPTPEIVSVPPINFLFPNQYLKIIPSKLFNDTKEWIEYTVFLGFAELFLFAFFFFTKDINQKLKLSLFSFTTIFSLLALGNLNNPSLLMPYTLLFRFLPFRGIIEPGRFYIFIYLTMTLAIVLFLRKFLAEAGKIGLGLILLFLIFERMPTNFYLSDTLKDKNFIKSVQQSDSKAVLDLPIFVDWWNGNRYDLYSVYYQKPIVNGYIHWSGNSPESQSFISKLKRFECNSDKNFELPPLGENKLIEEIDKNKELLPDLKGYDISTVVFHKDLIRNEKQCQEAVERITILLEESGIDFKKIFEDRDVVVYQLES